MKLSEAMLKGLEMAGGECDGELIFVQHRRVPMIVTGDLKDWEAQYPLRNEAIYNVCAMGSVLAASRMRRPIHSLTGRATAFPKHLYFALSDSRGSRSSAG